MADRLRHGAPTCLLTAPNDVERLARDVLVQVRAHQPAALIDAHGMDPASVLSVMRDRLGELTDWQPLPERDWFTSTIEAYQAYQIAAHISIQLDQYRASRQDQPPLLILYGLKDHTIGELFSWLRDILWEWGDCVLGVVGPTAHHAFYRPSGYDNYFAAGQVRLVDIGA